MNNDNEDVGNTQSPLNMHSKFDHFNFSFFIREVMFHVIILRKNKFILCFRLLVLNFFNNWLA
jgi:hypothetical protein